MPNTWIDEWETLADENNATPLIDEAVLEPAELDLLEEDGPETSAALITGTQDNAPAPRRRFTAKHGLAIAGGLAVFLVVLVLAVGPSRSVPPHQTPAAIPTLSAESLTTEVTNPAVPCAEESSPTRVVTSKPGDASSGAGVIAAFEASYFADRDPVAAAELLAPKMRVTAASIRRVMDENFPPGKQPIPYCATITPWTEADTWAVSVDWLDSRSGQTTTWTAIYRVAAINGELRITAQLADKQAAK